MRKVHEERTPHGGIFVGSPYVDFDDVVYLGLRRYYDVAELAVDGIRMIGGGC